jgi:hypothetical protein
MNVRHIVAAALLCWGTAALAESIAPDKLAKIQAEQGAAQDRIRIKYGNRKPSEMERDERRQMLEDERKAAQEVLDKHGVTAKDYARASSRLSRDDQARVQAESKALQQKETKSPSGGDGEVTIEYGTTGDDDGVSESRSSSKGSRSKSKSSKRRRR